MVSWPGIDRRVGRVVFWLLVIISCHQLLEPFPSGRVEHQQTSTSSSPAEYTAHRRGSSGRPSVPI